MKKYLINLLKRLCHVTPPPMLFNYSDVTEKFCEGIDNYLQRHPCLPTDVGCNVYRSLFAIEESCILRAMFLSLNDTAKRLKKLNESGDDQDQYVIPNTIKVEFHPFEKERESGFLSNIKFTFNYVYKVTIDPTHGTLTKDDIISSPKIIQTGIKDILVEKIEEMSYRITFLWMGETEVDYTIRSLNLLGTNTEEKIELAGTLLKGINHLSGKNGGCGGNWIRINTDLPADFVWVEVLPDNQVRIKLRDNSVYADLDGVRLELNNPTPFYVNSILNIGGICSLILK